MPRGTWDLLGPEVEPVSLASLALTGEFFFFFFTLHCLESPQLSHAAAAKSLQLCPTLCDPRDRSSPGSAVAGILQARTLEWVAISFSNA